MSTSREQTSGPDRCGFVPPYVLRHLAASRPDGCGPRTLLADQRLREHREALPPGATLRTTALPAAPEAAAWTVHDAGGLEQLPGTPVRAAGQPATGDPAVDEAAAGIEATLRFFAEVHDRASYDGAGAPAVVTVHFGRDYANAFWDGTQLVFGDGDGEVFERFTKPLDVMAHEFGHALTQATAGLVYEGQPGALNESVSDVVAACVKQWLAGESAADADWLVGEGLFRPGVQARALRDMAAPGTAYDDPRLGRDPQVGHLDDFVVTTDDNGGVHLNSGIPNRAFVLAARAVGGRTWEGAGAVWHAALLSGDLGPRTDFAGFAAATVSAAERVLPDHVETVRAAWRDVGVEPGRPSTGPAGQGPAATGVVEVRRSGGFAGTRVVARVDLADLAGDPRGDELVRLLTERDVRAEALGAGREAAGGAPQPDRFSYAFVLDGEEVVLPEQALTPSLQRLAGLVLDLGSTR
ncbi:protealysin inhibitor emfourin [Nocardioides perillae]|uniref:Neutral metalloproteinase n=1 Tax=Nocardioides perillae TaxID=1119534 RepID=A0A7Y9RTU9_9ACTN|nr:protealysin inhibitor emfourin [Nocardioides perillae]NYG54783.1 hypothetical protein [Nocardioides perillae]